MVRRLVAALRKTKLQSTHVLGGPQVMHQGKSYLSPHDEHVFVCNGEGERTFAGFLRAMMSPAPDYRQVRGVSFFADGELVTTPNEPRRTTSARPLRQWEQRCTDVT